jgi:superfamily I DNA and RNA helicase
MDSMEGIPSSEIPRKRALLRPDVINAKRFEKRLVEILETPVQANGNMPFMNEYLDEDSLFRLRNFLDGQGEKPDAGEIIKSTYENCFEEATEMQQMMMESISRNPRMRIEGVAGSGKSHMVVWDALRLSRIGKNVAIACYNDLLATELKQDVDKVISNDRIGVEKKYAQDGGVSYGRVDVYAYSEWCEKYVRAAKLKVDKSGDRSQYYDRELPQAFVKAQKILAKDKKKREKFFYDAVIIDEGQDFASEWVDGFIGLLHNEEHGIVRFFYDPAQRLYASRNGIDNAQVESMPVMVLNRGFRSTKRILEWVRKNTGFRLQAFDNIVLGDAVKEMHYRDGSEQAQMLSARIDELMEKKKLSVSDILVVSMKSDRNSALKNITDERLVWNTSGDKSLVKDKINIVSVYRIKGLDATAVILADLEEPVEASKREDWKRCMLVGATRAKALLTVFRKG